MHTVNKKQKKKETIRVGRKEAGLPTNTQEGETSKCGENNHKTWGKKTKTGRPTHKKLSKIKQEVAISLAQETSKTNTELKEEKVNTKQ